MAKREGEKEMTRKSRKEGGRDITDTCNVRSMEERTMSKRRVVRQNKRKENETRDFFHFIGSNDKLKLRSI